MQALAADADAAAVDVVVVVVVVVAELWDRRPSDRYEAAARADADAGRATRGVALGSDCARRGEDWRAASWMNETEDDNSAEEWQGRRRCCSAQADSGGGDLVSTDAAAAAVDDDVDVDDTERE